MYGSATARRLLGDCLSTAWRLLGDCSSTACRLLGDGLSDAWSLRKRQFSIEKAAKTQPNGVSGISGHLLCASPFKMCPSPKRGAQNASEWSVSQPKTTTPHARKSNEFAKRCTPLLKNEALAWEWTSLLSTTLLRSVKMHRSVTNTSIGHTHSTNKHWTVNVSDAIPSGFPNRDLVVSGRHKLCSE